MYQMTTAMRKVQFANTREVIDGLTNSGIAAFKALTVNHRDNTMKTKRAGGLLSWLDPKSEIPEPDGMPTELTPEEPLTPP